MKYFDIEAFNFHDISVFHLNEKPHIQFSVKTNLVKNYQPALAASFQGSHPKSQHSECPGKK